jgi:virginiamycin A acetyltransferase
MPIFNETAIYPATQPDGSPIRGTFNLRLVIDHPAIEVGAYSYYSDFSEPKPKDIAATIAPYLFSFSPEKLVIGKFVQIAHGTKFITSSANHPMAGISTYPFRIFHLAETGGYPDLPFKDTIVGPDVWIGYNAIIMPGVTIGAGAIVAAGSIVSNDVPPYAIVGGNPARLIRMRFDDRIVQQLLELAWWDWDHEKIERHIPELERCDLKALLEAV